MDKNRRYTLMVFPQQFDGNNIDVHIVLIPRNRNPFDPLDYLSTTDLTPFADIQLQFKAFIVNSMEEFPVSNSTAAGRVPIEVTLQGLVEASNKKDILTALRDQSGLKITVSHTADKAEELIAIEKSVRKYLPESYRNAFNFTTPRHRNAVTDDSYHCAMRNDKKNVPAAISDDISWGKVFSYILRQPLLARAAGFVYEATIPLTDASWFSKGGYLYVDLANNDYKMVQEQSLEHANGAFIKRYAARIPKLTAGTQRNLFAPILFPVMYRKSGDTVDPVPVGNWDRIFAESNEYNDGFAKIVHANQPVSKNILAEQFDGTHPVHDAGIRLSWDDEQILIWYIRQLRGDENNFTAPVPGVDDRIDFLFGVFGYRIDVRENTNTAGGWKSLNAVTTTANYKIGTTSIGNEAGENLELPYQVYPSQIDSNTGSSYWLPMYYTNWIGKSLVVRDDDAEQIYHHADSSTPTKSTTQQFAPVATGLPLIYGKTYDLRVRLSDISNGGPGVNNEPLHASAAPINKVNFKRYIAPGKLRISNIEDIHDSKANNAAVIYFFNAFVEGGETKYSATPVISVKRPLLGYPAVVFTNKYQSAGQDPVLLLKNIPAPAGEQVEPALADPDVLKVMVMVEAETLRMDNLLSESGAENYALLYITKRTFPAGFDDTLDIPVVFKDFPVLNLSNSSQLSMANSDPFNNPAFSKAALDGMADIVLPTARKIRITLRGLCEGDNTYYGFINEEDINRDTRFGDTTQFFFYKESVDEKNLLLPKANVPSIQAIYLQPDAPLVNDGKISTWLFRRETETNQPDIVQRLAKQLGVESKGLTLVAKKGERIVFGCSDRIRHSLAPDNSSITFASKADLEGHWLGCSVYNINRDWSWDAMDLVSFDIKRVKKFKADDNSEKEETGAGDIEINHSVSFEALQMDEFDVINRHFTTIIFIDAIEPKSALKQANGLPRFPDEMEVNYSITPHFKKYHAAENNITQPDTLSIPTTVRSAQVPKLASVGFAFSPYERSKKYSSTQPRQKYLWIELEEPVADPNDTVFARMLAYAPDQLISNNNPELFVAPKEPPLPIDPEYIRIITPGQSDDMAGLNAMQALIQATDSDRHYLLPIPPGMHSESAELFGFFTYEVRIGHGHWSDREENLWSTAQGRFGRALRVTGIQHPAPTLLCTVNRDNKRLYVTAPHAQAVNNGKNVTAFPPRTQLWCLLYAQVKQADGLDYRNILIGEKYLDWRKKAFIDKQREVEKNQLYADLKKADFSNKISAAINTDIFGNSTPNITPAGPTHADIISGAKLAIIKDIPVTGTAVWSNTEIVNALELFGLPDDSPLSVIVVEVFGNIKNFRQHITNLNQFGVREGILRTAETSSIKDENEQASFRSFTYQASEMQTDVFATVDIKPLSSGLGHYRILRTSLLTEVPFVCCTTCYPNK